jgi:hypothetical protein
MSLSPTRAQRFRGLFRPVAGCLVAVAVVAWCGRVPGVGAQGITGRPSDAADKLRALARTLPPGTPIPTRLENWTMLSLGRLVVPGAASLRCDLVTEFGDLSTTWGSRRRIPIISDAIAGLAYENRRDLGYTPPSCEVSFLPPSTARSYLVTFHICWSGAVVNDAPGYTVLRDQPPVFQLTTSVDASPLTRAVNPDPGIDMRAAAGLSYTYCGAAVAPVTPVRAARQFVRMAPAPSTYWAYWYLISVEIDRIE